MSKLHALLGDRATLVLQAAIAADDPDHLRKAQLVGGNLGQLMWLTTAERLDRVLMAVLPDLLAEAWDEGVAVALDHAIRNPDGITLRLEHLNGDPWSNPYRTEETDHA